MRDLAVLTFVTLDGVMQGVSSPEEDPSGGFTKGGWAMPYWADVMAQVQREAMATPYDILFGRTTYEMFAANRPPAESRSPIDKRMDEATKYVASTKLTTVRWTSTTILNGDVAAKVAELKAQQGPLIQVHGSWQLIQSLLEHDLIDVFRLWVFPVILGSGKRLFGDSPQVKRLELIKTEPSGNGVVMSFFRRSR